MPIPSEIRESLKDRIGAINLSLSELARISGMNTSTLSHFIAGRFTPPNDELQRMHQILSRMERLADRCRPVPINFKDAELIHILLAKLDSNLLAITVMDPDRLTSGLSVLAGK
jgi:transcriptional regulator with XRE-family HTH domain